MLRRRGRPRPGSRDAGKLTRRRTARPHVRAAGARLRHPGAAEGRGPGSERRVARHHDDSSGTRSFAVAEEEMVPTAADRRQSLRGEELRRTAEENWLLWKNRSGAAIRPRTSPCRGVVRRGPCRSARRRGRQPGDSGLTAIRMPPSLASFAHIGTAPARRSAMTTLDTAPDLTRRRRARRAALRRRARDDGPARRVPRRPPRLLPGARRRTADLGGAGRPHRRPPSAMPASGWSSRPSPGSSTPTPRRTPESAATPCPRPTSRR